jgi:hypothetical protein
MILERLNFNFETYTREWEKFRREIKLQQAPTLSLSVLDLAFAVVKREFSGVRPGVCD